MPDQRITQYGMRLFITALADILAEFHQTPLDDRCSIWLMRRLKSRLSIDMNRDSLSDAHRASVLMLFIRLEELCHKQGLDVEYGMDE